MACVSIFLFNCLEERKWKNMSDELVEKCKAYCGLMDNDDALELALEVIKRLDYAGRELLKSKL